MPSQPLRSGAIGPPLSPGETVAAALQQAATLLQASGVPESRLDAELLLAEALGWGRAQLHLRGGQRLSAAQASAYSQWVARRCQREPLPYIVGHAAFYDLDLAVTPAVLIPRPETELLVELALAHASQRGLSSPTVVDVGTGSGAVAIALARALPAARVMASDVSSEALRVAAANACRHGVMGRIGLWQGDLLAACRGPVDLLIANLPYVRRDERAQLEPEVAVYEPWLALDGGPDGLDLVRRLLGQAAGLLAAGGLALLEIGASQGAAAVAAARAAFPASDVSLRQDYAGLDRVVVIHAEGG